MANLLVNTHRGPSRGAEADLALGYRLTLERNAASDNRRFDRFGVIQPPLILATSGRVHGGEQGVNC